MRTQGQFRLRGQLLCRYGVWEVCWALTWNLSHSLVLWAPEPQAILRNCRNFKRYSYAEKVNPGVFEDTFSAATFSLILCFLIHPDGNWSVPLCHPHHSRLNLGKHAMVSANDYSDRGGRDSQVPRADGQPA